MFLLNKKYAAFFLLLLCLEFYIALFVKDKFVRPYLGDFLVVILIYCFIKMWLNCSFQKAILGVLLFAYLVEFLQYFSIVKLLGLENNKVASIVIGTSFSCEDLIAYTCAAFFLYVVESHFAKNKTQKSFTLL